MLYPFIANLTNGCSNQDPSATFEIRNDSILGDFTYSAVEKLQYSGSHKLRVLLPTTYSLAAASTKERIKTISSTSVSICVDDL